MRRIVPAVVFVIACGSAGSTARSTVQESVLARYDFDRETAQYSLPNRLDEISGLAFSREGRLFAHDDERARVYQIDPETGEVGKRFDLGEGPVQGDFEGIAVAGERFFLITSLGLLYEFREGADRSVVPFRVTDTRLGANCEVEGLDVDPGAEELLIACKESTPDRRFVVVHRLPLDPGRAVPGPIRVRKDALAAFGVPTDFDPSAIAVADGDRLILVSGRHHALMEIDRSGAIVAARSLARSRHRQPEGLAIGADGRLYLADEADGRDARLTVYSPVEREGAR